MIDSPIRREQAMPRKILVFFMSMVLLGGYSISVCRAQGDSGVDQEYPIYWLKGEVWVDDVKLQPTQFDEHKEYTLVPEVRKTDAPATDWTELTARGYQMGSEPTFGDEYSIKILNVDETDGFPIKRGENFEMRMAIYMKGNKFTYPDVKIGTTPPGEAWYVGKPDLTTKADANVYAYIPPGQPENLQAAATVGSEIRNINLQWTAPGENNGVGTVSGYLARFSDSDITTEPQWNLATPLTTGWTSLLPAGSTENRTAISPSALNPDGTYYVALRAVDAVGPPGPFTSAPVNMPPKAQSVVIAPSDPPDAETTDDLVLTYSYSDAEGDPESGTQIRWYKVITGNDVLQSGYNSQTLPWSATTKGETWKASVQPANANGMGLEVKSNPLTIINTPPVANPIDPAGPYTSKIDSGGNTVLPITFNGTGSSDADGDPLTYEWTFGDGTTGTGPTPTHTYPAILPLYPHTFPVTLKVHDGEVYSVTASTTATVTINKKPVADVGGPYDAVPPIAGEPLTFDGSGSDDPDVDEDISDLLFKWDFDNDGNVDYESPTRGISSATHTYPAPGTYTASLVVSDYLEDSAPDTVSVLVKARPVAAFTWDPTTPDEGSQVDFSDASTDADGTVVAWSWDFDDDGVEDSNLQNPSYIYMDDGVYPVTLTVTDNDGLESLPAVDSVTVNDLGPTAGFTWDPEIQVEGSAVDFADASISYPDDIASWAWDFDDGGTSTDQNPSYIFMDDGIYTVTLTVTDDDESTDTITHDVIITDAEPTAAFTWTPDPPAEGSLVQFTDTSTSPADVIDTWAWDFDDGGTSTDQNPTHTFMADGTYTVTLTVTDDDESTDTIQQEVTVTDAAPTAAFTWTPDPPAEGSLVQFTDTSTSPADVIDTWAWDFDDGGTSTDQNPTHTFMADGTYTVTLTVTDDDESTDTIQQDVIVTDAAPTAEFTWAPDPQDEGSAVDFTDASTSPADAIVEWAWDFADSTSTEQNPSHTFMDDGTYTVTLTVTDDDGSTDAVQHDVTVNDLGPTAEFTWSPEPQVEGTAVDFTDASTSAPDDIASWAWDFDDGGTSTAQNPSYIFMDDGTYTVTLTVTDDDGSTDIVQHDVTITDAAPTAEFTSVPEPQVEGSAVDFTDASTSPADVIDTWAWDFDDGGTSAVQNPSHVYTDNGTYTVGLTVTDDDGSTDDVQHDVTITDAAPTAEFTWAPAEPVEGTEVQFTDTSTSPADDIVAWSWDFDDGGTSTEQNPSYTFMDDGTYTVSLTVTDDDNSTGTVQYDVTVTDGTPTAAFTWTPEPQVEGSAVDFTDTSTSPADAIVAWSWDFDGDGTEDSNLQNPSYTFMDDGTYTVSLTVTDDDGDPDTVQNDVTITDGAPTASFTWTPEPQDEGSPVQFTDTSTSPADVIDTWAWDFADSTSTEQNPSHVYADNGAYAVTLTVTDDDGDSDTIQNTVNIENVAPVVDAGPGDLEVPVRKPVNITVEFSDVGTADTHTATINWKDGTIEPGVVSEVNGSGTVTGSHIYVVAGEFNVVVTITDDDGDSATHSMKVTAIGIEILDVTFNVLDPTLIVELDEPVEPDLTNFDLIGMEVNDSGNWDYQMSQERGLNIEETTPSTILHIDMKRDWINSSQLIRQALVNFLPVDFLARMGAFGDAAGSENLEVTGADDMRITMVANGLILGTLGDVSGNGVFTSYDVALVAKAIVGGLKELPISSVTSEVELLLPGKPPNIAKNTADINRDNGLDASDLLTGLRLVSGYDDISAPPDIASDTKRCRLSVNNYDNGELDVSIDVEDVSGVYCADIVIGYDPGTLTVADVSKTSSISGWVFADAAESGKLRISMAGLSQPAANGSLVNVSIDAASADAIKELQIVELKLNGGRSRAEIENLPKAFALMPNYPNPFNPETWIPYQLTVPANVTVSIYNLNGQIVRRLELGTRMPGSYINRSKAAYWDGRNESGEMVSSGIYFYQLQAGRDAAVRKMVIVK
jgi:PKD repeat protein